MPAAGAPTLRPGRMASRPAVPAPERRLWVDFCRAFGSRSFATESKQAKLQGSMNVSTVFPEDYPPPQEEPSEQQAGGHADQRNHQDSRQQRPQSSRRTSRGKDIVGLEEVSRISFLLPLFSEALGTCLLVIIGCASCLKHDVDPTVLHIGLTFGLAVASLAYVLGPVSGCHVNPAVTIGLLISGNCTILRALCYVVCQSCGAIAGSAILKAALPVKLAQKGLGMTNLGPEVSYGQGVLIEGIVTFLLVLVVHAVTDPRREDCRGWAPLGIGLTISVAHLAAVPLTGSSMNPARSLGPAVIAGLWTEQWLYWVGPLAGAVVAGALYRLGLGNRAKDDEQASYDF